MIKNKAPTDYDVSANYTVGEVAEMFDCNYRSVIRYIRIGWLNATKKSDKRWTISGADIKTFIEDRYTRRWEMKRKNYKDK